MKRRAALSVVVATAMFLGGSVATSVSRATAAPAISPATIASTPAHVGDAFQVTLAFAGAPTWSVTSGQLPPGLALSGGQISGVPTQAGAFTFVVRASDSGAIATKAYTILVSPPASTGYDSRVDQVLVQRDVFPPAGVCNRTGDLTYAIADLWLGSDVANANNLLAAVNINQIGTAKACDHSTDQSRNNLALGYLVRPYMLYHATSSYFPGRLTTAAENNLVAQMWTFARAYSKVSEAANTWSIFDSENHDAEAESFYLLAAQIFMHRPDYANQAYGDHTKAVQQYNAWRAHWSNYLDERAKRGLFIESGAPTYAGYTLAAILNIYNFAEDPVLRQKAGMVLDLEFADYAEQSLHDLWGGPKSRSYPADSYDGANDSMTNLGKLLFGSVSTIGGDNHVLMLATSGYYPPPVVETLGTNRPAMGSYEYITRRPGVGVSFPDPNHNWTVTPSRSVLAYAYSTPSYIMGTAELWPNDAHIAPSSQNRWEGITFDTGPGDRIYPQAAPSRISPCNDAFMSIQFKNTLITQKRPTGPSITTGCRTKATLVYFPNTLDSIVERSGWLFVTQGSSYVAIRPATGTYHWLTADKNHASNRDDRFIQLTNNASPIIFQAGRTAQFTGPAQFQDRVIRSPLTYAAGVLHYKSLDTTQFTFFHDTSTPPLMNNHELNYSPKDVFNSPFMTSVFGSGLVTIRFGAQRATYDFRNALKPVKTVQ